MHFRQTILLLLICLSATLANAADAEPDPIGAEITKWKNYVQTNTATDENWVTIKGIAEPVITKADKAFAAGQKYYALHLLAAVRPMLAAEKYTSSFPSEMREQLAAFESEWKKTGDKIAPILEGKERFKFDGLPAFYRAVGEAAFSEVKVYYDASIEYGRNTVPDAGLYYVGSTLSQLEFARIISQMRPASAGKSVTPANLEIEIKEFEDRLLAAYKPPASIDSHPVFIRTSAMIKQAHELRSDQSNYGALYRYLAARYRLAEAVPPGKTLTEQEAAARAGAMMKELEKDGKDHSIAQMFVEMALFESADTSPESKGGQNAYIIFEDVLPHYFAALKEPEQKQIKAPAEVKVTLVRWPYT